MALVKGTNSYVTEAEADEYFEDRLDSTDWDNASNDTRDKALVTAWHLLDQLAWAGSSVSSTQAMAWPRVINGFVDSRLGRTYQVNQSAGDDAVDEVKIAQYELAKHLITNTTVLNSGTTVSNLTVGALELGSIRNPSVIPAFVRQRVQRYLLNGSSNNWFLAN